MTYVKEWFLVKLKLPIETAIKPYFTRLPILLLILFHKTHEV